MNIKPAGLPSAFTIAIIALCCRADNAFIGYYAITGCAEVLVASFAAGVLISSIVLAFTWQSESRTPYKVVLWTIVSLFGVFASWMGTNADPSTCAEIGGALLGLGSVGMVGQWAFCYSRFEHEEVLPTVAATMLLMSIVWFMLHLMSGFINICMALALCVVCSGVAAFVESITALDQERELEEPPAVDDRRNRLEVRAALTSFEAFVFDGSSHASRWHAFEAGSALMLGFFVTGAAFWTNVSEIELSAAFMKPVSYLIACIVVLMVSRFAVSISYKGHDERQPMRVVLVVAACIVLAGALASAFVGDGARSLVRMGNFVAFALLNVHGIAYTFADLVNSGISPVRSGVVAVCLCYIGMALGMLAYLLLGSAVCFVVGAAALAYAGLVIVIAVQAVHGGRTSKDYRRNA